MSAAPAVLSFDITTGHTYVVSLWSYTKRYAHVPAGAYAAIAAGHTVNRHLWNWHTICGIVDTANH